MTTLETVHPALLERQQAYSAAQDARAEARRVADENFVRRLRQELDKSSDLTLSQLARDLGMTRQHLHDLFRRFPATQ